MTKILIVFYLVICSQFLLAGEGLLDKAVEAQSSQRYEEAVDTYQQVLKTGLANGYIFYNLGNAYFRLGRKGEAMAAYLAARNLLPRDPDVELNIKHIRKDSVDKLAVTHKGSVISKLAFWSGWFNLAEQVFTFGFLMFLAGAVFLVGMLKNSLHTLKTVAIGLWIFAAIVAFGASINWQQDSRWGAVTVEVASIYSGPGKAGNSILFELHESAPFVLLERRDQWLRIALSDGKQGWVAKDQVRYYSLSSS